MAFSRKYFNLFKYLLPKSNAFNITIQKNLTKFFEGLTALPNDFRTFIDSIFLDLFPGTTRSPELWEDQFGIRMPNSDDTIRRNNIDTQWKLKGGQSAFYLQKMLRDAGFDVYVYENNPRVDPDIFLSSNFVMTCGNSWAVCGNDLAYMGKTGGYVLANGYVSNSSDKRKYLAICDSDSNYFTSAGLPTSCCGYFEEFFVYPKEYIVTDDYRYWTFIFFIGGNATYESTVIDNSVKITTYSGSFPSNVENERILFQKSDNKIYIKSVNNIDNETLLVNYSFSQDQIYIDDDEMVFLKAGIMCKKSINDLNNETAITTYLCASPVYVDSKQVVFIKDSDGFVYIKSTENVDNAIRLTTYHVDVMCYIGNLQIAFIKNNKLYKKNIYSIDGETQLTTYDVTQQRICYVGDNKILFNMNGKTYIKSVNDVDNERLLINSLSIGIAYIGNDQIVYGGSYLYKKSIKQITRLKSINTVTLDKSRRDEFEELILKIKPANTWAGLLIEYK